jgi:uncharacterized protein (DUF885 family)
MEKLELNRFMTLRAWIRKHAVLAVAAAFVCLGTPQAGHAGETESQQSPFRTLLEDYWRDRLHLNPGLALAVGDYSSEERFDDSLTDGWRAQMLWMLQHYSDALAAFDPARLSQEDQISYRMLRYKLDSDLAFYGSRSFELARLLPIDQFQGLHVQYAVEAAGSGAFPYKTVADYDKALLRADAFSRWADAAIKRLREGVAQGIVLPAIIVERMLPQLEVHLGLAPERTRFWHPIETLPVVPALRLHQRLRRGLGVVC